MADPKGAIETALYAALVAGLGGTAVYNTTALAASLPYVVMQASGGDDEGYHLKAQGWIYRYDVLGVAETRAAAVALNALFTGTLKTGLTVAGYSTVSVTRTAPLDYPQTLPDGGWVFFVGGTYEIEVE
jgi:hypothetical protein